MVIKRVLRFVFRDKSSSHEELCKRIGPSSLREQRLAKILSIVFNILASDAGPESLSDLIAARRSTYNLGGTTDNTGPSKILDQSKINNFRLRSWRYTTLNAIPDESQKIQTYTFRFFFLSYLFLFHVSFRFFFFLAVIIEKRLNIFSDRLQV